MSVTPGMTPGTNTRCLGTMVAHLMAAARPTVAADIARMRSCQQ
jgi:hypothetical protein